MDLSTAENIHAVWVGRETADHCRSNTRVVRVVPGEPESSFVVTLIEAQPGRCKDQERMPPSPLPVLEDEEVKIITDWIAAGAKDD